MKENCGVVFSHLGPWLLYVPPGLKLKNSTFCTHTHTQCVYVFCVDLKRRNCLLAAAGLVIRSLLSYCVVVGVGLQSKMVDQVTVVSFFLIQLSMFCKYDRMKKKLVSVNINTCGKVKDFKTPKVMKDGPSGRAV